jgi:hypothetical protein
MPPMPPRDAVDAADAALREERGSALSLITSLCDDGYTMVAAQ